MNNIIDIDKLIDKLFSINRSITGDGVLKTLNILKKYISLNIIEYKSGEKVYNWEIPDEWNIKDAWVKDSKGEKIIDFNDSFLHVVSYSIPIHKKIKGCELKKNLHYLEDLPNAIPYRTSYYNRTWGFCLSYHDYINKIKDEEIYEIFVDSDIKKGKLYIGEVLLKGKLKEEILISTYICHPNMGNDNMSGILTTLQLVKELEKKDLNYSYRIIFNPETIGAISYCFYNEDAIKKIKLAFVITTCAGGGQYGYKQSYNNNHFINEIIEDVFIESKISFIKYPFDIHGSDERQFSSIGFRINTCSITKDKYQEYKFYHTSLDDKNFISSGAIIESASLYLKTIEKIEMNLLLLNTNTHCEVMLSKYDLYSTLGGIPNNSNNSNNITEKDVILWLLFYCDGKTDLFTISKKTTISLSILYDVSLKLINKKLLKKIN